MGGTTASISEREQGRRDEEAADAAGDGGDEAQPHRDVHAHRVLEDGGVGGEAVGELPRLLLVEEGDVLIHQPREEVGPEPGDDALARDGEEREAQRHRHRPHQRDADHLDRIDVEGRRPAPGRPQVDDACR